jgi:uncharacterized protein
MTLKAAFPEFVLSTIEDVAEELVTALDKRQKPRVVQGWKNRMMLFGFKLWSPAFNHGSRSK